MLVGAPLGVDIMIMCNAEASPKAINYWQRENGMREFHQFSLLHIITTQNSNQTVLSFDFGETF